MKFYTIHNRPGTKKRVFSPYRYTYHYEVKENGETEFVRDEVPINFVEEIQQDRGMTPAEMVKRYELTKDPSVLQQRVKQNYGDYTGLTGSLVEMQAKLSNARYQFEDLPLEIRQKYDNDFLKFCANVDNGQFFKYIEALSKKSEPQPAPGGDQK